MNRETTEGTLIAEGAWHQIDLPLRWGDMDALNHLNNTIYFRVMEEARISILLQAGLKLPDSEGPILAHASCDFIKPFGYPATVRVTHRLVRLGRSSMELDLTLEKVGDSSGPYARGRNVLVWMDYVANCSKAWPADVLARLGAQFTAA
ncbi:acyl-CoA thioesterase [Bordetella holmesii]|uniref:Thioesterase family protein n=2 Tax=Bordetella holmesii TaxID=35814 RepID=A0A158M552_9BORD|nr:acyl-CoA thioesterase [Bordetella holmesii]AHV93291.1 thioesterase superfamily protein [Bordetella holmesii ATCC 51541]AIT26996.1 thioesterase superfamily protein [Bordetella holmesii 44057]EWM44002.1 thioesterase superfamily protein [Bordetella holmesii 41130]EWM47580.1 thioesterase superfamily protein [Bordetella holmesii 35009]EWM51747.1 thioesterase superfamily protein [Bordetella holmesii 70147]